jgi:hypothetical protein
LSPNIYNIIGLLFDIIGAFLVSIEAIKLKNIVIIRDKITNSALIFIILVQLISAVIVFTIIEKYSKINLSIMAMQSIFILIAIFFSIFIVYLFYTLLITILTYIEKKTPDGTIGILGFIFLLFGFILQIYSNYLLMNQK